VTMATIVAAGTVAQPSAQSDPRATESSSVATIERHRPRNRRTRRRQRSPARARLWSSASKDVRKQVERLVKAPGAPLKSAPFHTAGTLQLLTPGTEVLILISTPYWYGVETHEGQHGWMERDQLSSHEFAYEDFCAPRCG